MKRKIFWTIFFVLLIISVIVVCFHILKNEERSNEEEDMTYKTYLSNVHPTKIIWIGNSIKWYTDTPDIICYNSLDDVNDWTFGDYQYICVVIYDSNNLTALSDDGWNRLTDFFNYNPRSMVFYIGNKGLDRLLQYDDTFEGELSEEDKSCLNWYLSYSKEGNKYIKELCIGDLKEEDLYNEYRISQSVLMKCANVIKAIHKDWN